MTTWLRRRQLPARTESHYHAVLGTQSDERVRLDYEAGLETELVMAMEEDRHNRQLLQRKLIPDAAARTGPERKINHRLGRRAALRREARRVKFLRLDPETVAPMEMKDGHNHVHAR